MPAKVLSICLGIFCILLPCAAEERTVRPQGAFATIDTRLAAVAIQVLSKGTAEEKQRTIARIREKPETFAPPVFYALSETLFQRGDRDEAAFWFYAGQLRARFDANRCADVSARQAVAVLNQRYGSPINQYTFQDLPKLEALVPRVVDWDQRTAHEYDHRWINLHGMDAMQSGLEPKRANAAPGALSAPREQWQAIAEKTRADYLEGFRQAMAQVRATKKK